MSRPLRNEFKRRRPKGAHSFDKTTYSHPKDADTKQKLKDAMKTVLNEINSGGSGIQEFIPLLKKHPNFKQLKESLLFVKKFKSNAKKAKKKVQSRTQYRTDSLQKVKAKVKEIKGVSSSEIKAVRNEHFKKRDEMQERWKREEEQLQKEFEETLERAMHKREKLLKEAKVVMLERLKKIDRGIEIYQSKVETCEEMTEKAMICVQNLMKTMIMGFRTDNKDISEFVTLFGSMLFGQERTLPILSEKAPSPDSSLCEEPSVHMEGKVLVTTLQSKDFSKAERPASKLASPQSKLLHSQDDADALPFCDVTKSSACNIASAAESFRADKRLPITTDEAKRQPQQKSNLSDSGVAIASEMFDEAERELGQDDVEDVTFMDDLKRQHKKLMYFMATHDPATLRRLRPSDKKTVRESDSAALPISTRPNADSRPSTASDRHHHFSSAFESLEGANFAYEEGFSDDVNRGETSSASKDDERHRSEEAEKNKKALYNMLKSCGMSGDNTMSKEDEVRLELMAKIATGKVDRKNPMALLMQCGISSHILKPDMHDLDIAIVPRMQPEKRVAIFREDETSDLGLPSHADNERNALSAIRGTTSRSPVVATKKASSVARRSKRTSKGRGRRRRTRTRSTKKDTNDTLDYMRVISSPGIYLVGLLYKTSKDEPSEYFCCVVDDGSSFCANFLDAPNTGPYKYYTSSALDICIYCVQSLYYCSCRCYLGHTREKCVHVCRVGFHKTFQTARAYLCFLRSLLTNKEDEIKRAQIQWRIEQRAHLPLEPPELLKIIFLRVFRWSNEVAGIWKGKKSLSSAKKGGASKRRKSSRKAATDPASLAGPSRFELSTTHLHDFPPGLEPVALKPTSRPALLPIADSQDSAAPYFPDELTLDYEQEDAVESNKAWSSIGSEQRAGSEKEKEKEEEEGEDFTAVPVPDTSLLDHVIEGIGSYGLCNELTDCAPPDADQMSSIISLRQLTRPTRWSIEKMHEENPGELVHPFLHINAYWKAVGCPEPGTTKPTRKVACHFCGMTSERSKNDSFTFCATCRNWSQTKNVFETCSKESGVTGSKRGRKKGRRKKNLSVLDEQNTHAGFEGFVAKAGKDGEESNDALEDSECTEESQCEAMAKDIRFDSGPGATNTPFIPAENRISQEMPMITTDIPALASSPFAPSQMRDAPSDAADLISKNIVMFEQNHDLTTVDNIPLEYGQEDEATKYCYEMLPSYPTASLDMDQRGQAMHYSNPSLALDVNYKPFDFFSRHMALENPLSFSAPPIVVGGGGASRGGPLSLPTYSGAYETGSESTVPDYDDPMAGSLRRLHKFTGLSVFDDSEETFTEAPHDKDLLSSDLTADIYGDYRLQNDYTSL